MKEVIARRKDSLFTFFVVLLTIIIVFLGGSLIHMLRLLGIGMSFEKVIALLLAVVVYGLIFAPLIGILIWQIKKFRKTPPTPIVLENEKISFANHFECSILEIQNVTYRQARGGRWRYVFAWGRLTVNVRGRDITYDFIENVVAAHDRLLALMLRAREKNNG